MKKILIVTFLTLCYTTSLLEAQDIRFGFQISPSYSWLLSDDKNISSNAGNLGLKLGVLGEFYFRENYAITGGLGFSFNSGGELHHLNGGTLWAKSELSDENFRNLPDNSNLDYNIQYVEIPLGLKLRSNEFGYLRYFAEIPIFTLGFRTQARGDISGEINSDKENIRNDVNFFNLSWGLGGGAEYNVNENTTLYAGIYYQQGFADVTDDAGTIITFNDNGDEQRKSEDSKGTIGSVTLRIGVLF